MAAGARDGLAERAKSTAVDTIKPPTVVELIRQQKSQIEYALPSHLKQNADAFIRNAITVLKRNPGLAKCEPLSVVGGLMTAAALGLEVGPLQLAYLVPRKGKAEFQVGYRGYIELGYRSGMLRDITAEAVCENDAFHFDRAGGEISHTWDLRADRGPAYAYYAIANFKDGGRAFVVLSKSDVEKFRKRSAAPNSPAWRDDYDAMAKKTAIRRLEPYLPKATEKQELGLAHAFSADGHVASGLTADEVEIEDGDWIEGEVVDEGTGEILTNLGDPLPEDPVEHMTGGAS